MTRPQFTLKTMLWLMAVVVALFGGMAWQRKLVDIELTKQAEALDRRGEELNEFQRNLIVAAKILGKKKELLRWAESQEKPNAERTPDDDEVEAAIEESRRALSEIRYSGGTNSAGRRATTQNHSPH